MTKSVVSCWINGKLHFLYSVYPTYRIIQTKEKPFWEISIINPFLLNQNDTSEVERFLPKLRFFRDRDNLKKNQIPYNYIKAQRSILRTLANQSVCSSIILVLLQNEFNNGEVTVKGYGKVSKPFFVDRCFFCSE